MKDEEPRSRLRVGFLVDGPTGSKYVRDLVQWVADSPDCDPPVLIVHPGPRAGGAAARLVAVARSGGLYRAFSRAAFKLLVAIERIVLARHPTHRDHLAGYDLAAIAAEQIVVTPRLSPSGFVYRFDESDLARVRALGLDVLVRCGNGILRGPILESARFGVLSFHHGDNAVNRGGPAGFWEVYLGQRSTGFTLQRLTEELDGGDALLRGHFLTAPYYLLNQAKLYAKSNHYMKKALADLAATRHLPQAAPQLPYSYPLYRVPGAHVVARYGLRSLAWVAGKALRRLAGRRWVWGVAYCRTDWTGAALWRGIRIPNPRGRFLADPFVIERDGADYCFAEDFSFRDGRGRISAYRLGETRAEPLGVALDADVHLSFPFLFEHEGALFLCPETSQARQIRIYRCIEFPLKWRLERVAMDEVDAADTMIFEADGRWWMLTNIDPSGTGEIGSELFLFWADNPLGDWQPHPANPVLIDSRCARNGGLLRSEGRLYRVAQQTGFNMYGSGSTIFRIDRLTEAEYAESRVGEITPHFFRDARGTHHLHSSGRVTVFDFVRDVRPG